MSRNGLYAPVGVLAVAVMALGQAQKPKLEIKLDQSGIQVQGNG